MPSYDVKSGDQSVLAQKINTTQTTNVKIAAMNINGSPTAWANTAGVIEVSERADATLKREWIYYTGTSIDATTQVATLSGVVRGIARDTSDVTSGSTGQAFAKGATVRFVTFHDLLNKKANLDRVNTFSAAQTIADTVKLLFGGAGNWVRSDGTDLKFKDGNNSETTLSTLTAAAGVDTKVLVSNNDTTSGFLNGKLVVADGIAFTENSNGANETLSIGTRLDANGGLEFNSGEQRVKLPAGSGITRDSTGIYITGNAFVPTGAMFQWATKTAPTGYLLCYGQAVSRATYATLLAAIRPTLGTFTVTIATPGVFTLNSHGLVAGDPIYLTTTGALPTGLAINTLYYVIATGLTANAFQVSASRGGAAIDTTGTQSGVHTAFSCPFGLGDGTTTFNLPDFRSRVPVGFDLMGAGAASTRTTSPTASNISETAAGAEKHQLSTAELAAHTHVLQYRDSDGVGTGSWTSSGAPDGSTSSGVATAGSDTPHNNMQPYLTVSYIIKT